MRNFRYLETIKEALERECPGVVSCADILVLSARDGIASVGGPYIPLITGRRDGRKIRANILEQYLPDHNERSLDRAVSMDVDGDQLNKKMRLSRSLSRSRSKSRPPGEVVPGEGFKDTAQKQKAIKMAKQSVKKRNKDARKGETDRVIPTLKLKHLFSGKFSTGKTDRR